MFGIIISMLSRFAQLIIPIIELEVGEAFAINAAFARAKELPNPYTNPIDCMQRSATILKKSAPPSMLNALNAMKKGEVPAVVIRGLITPEEIMEQSLNLTGKAHIMESQSAGLNWLTGQRPVAYASRAFPWRRIKPTPGFETLSGSSGGGELSPHTDWPYFNLKYAAEQLSLFCKMGHPEVPTGYAPLQNVARVLPRKAVESLFRSDYLNRGIGTTQTLNGTPSLDLYKPILQIPMGPNSWTPGGLYTQLESLDMPTRNVKAQSALGYLGDAIRAQGQELVLQEGDFMAFSNNQGYHWRPQIPSPFQGAPRDLVRQSSSRNYFTEVQEPQRPWVIDDRTYNIFGI